MNLTMTHHESYGILPVHLLRMVKRFNVSPADWDGLTTAHGTNWETIRETIGANLIGTSYSSFKAGL